MKKPLDKLLLCDLYQISEEPGYIDRRNIHGKNPVNFELDSMYFVNKIGSVIVKKSRCFKYNLRELLTGTPINTLYEVSDDYSICDWYDHTVTGMQTEYDTFIVVPTRTREITVDRLEEYIKDHKDVEGFRTELAELLKKGSNNHFNKKLDEMEKASEEELKVKALLKSIKRSR